MALSDTVLELRCTRCDWSETCDVTGMLAWLRAYGSLKRATDPDPETVVELFRSKRETFACPECDAELLIEKSEVDTWPQTRACESCGQSIAPERLTAIPSANNCAVCQEKVDRGEPTGEAEYCPHCGGIMTIRQSDAGLARYVMRCGDCGR